MMLLVHWIKFCSVLFYFVIFFHDKWLVETTNYNLLWIHVNSWTINSLVLLKRAFSWVLKSVYFHFLVKKGKIKITGCKSDWNVWKVKNMYGGNKNYYICKNKQTNKQTKTKILMYHAERCWHLFTFEAQKFSYWNIRLLVTYSIIQE